MYSCINLCLQVNIFLFRTIHPLFGCVCVCAKSEVSIISHNLHRWIFWDSNFESEPYCFVVRKNPLGSIKSVSKVSSVTANFQNNLFTTTIHKLKYVKPGRKVTSTNSIPPVKFCVSGYSTVIIKSHTLRSILTLYRHQHCLYLDTKCSS